MDAKQYGWPTTAPVKINYWYYTEFCKLCQKLHIILLIVLLIILHIILFIKIQ